jgi:hypothetical protein
MEQMRLIWNVAAAFTLAQSNWAGPILRPQSAAKRGRSLQIGGTAPGMSSSLCPFRIQNLEPTAGFEPATRYLQNSCSAS